nr:hypothetical protein [Clostridiales bacterium]
SHMTASGIEVSVEGVGAVSFSDSDPLYIAYISEECEYDGGLDGALSDTARDGQVSWMRRANLANQLEIFLAGGEGSTLSSDEKRAGVEVDQAVYDKENRRYIAHFIQKIDGCVIDGCEGYFSVKNDKVDYFKGSAVLLSGPSAYKAELLDEINVLFLELDDMLGVADAPQGVTAAAPTGQPSRTVTGTSPVYCVIWNSDRSEFYLIPSWRISYRYADGETGESIRNAVNGSVYLR